MVTTATLALAACGTGPGSDPGAEQDATGADLYASNCASCHGSDLRGTDRGPSHLSVVYKLDHHGDDGFRAAIASGSAQHHWNFGDMPPVEGLNSDEVDQIISYVRSVQEREGFEAYPP